LAWIAAALLLLTSTSGGQNDKPRTVHVFVVVADHTLKAALDGWIAGEDLEQVRDRAAAAYDKYQKCGARAARRLLVTGW
jgi:hypothetical protein